MRKLEAFCCREASEGFVSLDLVLWSQLDRSLWDDMAIVFDGSHVVEKPVDLLKVNSHD